MRKLPDFSTIGSPLAIALHDAGAANLVIGWLKSGLMPDVRAHAGGPAELLWRKAFPQIATMALSDALSGAVALVSGTGWASDIEHDARKAAQSLGIKSIAVIDHWVNYAERFVRNGERVWPDEFWVADEYALEIALRTFPGKFVLQFPNYYVENQLRYLAHVEKTGEPELLYVLEPMRADWGRGIPGEFQALDYFIGRLPELGLPAETVINLRPHPSDPHGKYSNWIDLHSEMKIKLDTSLSIAESLGRATWVAGCESFALVLALMAGRKVYCTLPPWAPLCRLPHRGLIQLGRSSK